MFDTVKSPVGGLRVEDDEARELLLDDVSLAVLELLDSKDADELEEPSDDLELEELASTPCELSDDERVLLLERSDDKPELEPLPAGDAEELAWAASEGMELLPEGLAEEPDDRGPGSSSSAGVSSGLTLGSGAH
jgi:hypothetical protein